MKKYSKRHILSAGKFGAITMNNKKYFLQLKMHLKPINYNLVLLNFSYIWSVYCICSYFLKFLIQFCVLFFSYLLFCFVLLLSKKNLFAVVLIHNLACFGIFFKKRNLNESAIYWNWILFSLRKLINTIHSN